MTDIALRLETAYAKKLGKELNESCRVEIFADIFAGLGKATKKAQLIFGHRSSTYQTFTDVPIVTQEETATFEARLEVVDIKNHRTALDFISKAVAILNGYTPYTNIKPLVASGYGSPQFNREVGIWVYPATFTTRFPVPGKYELIEGLPQSELITIGLYNSKTLTMADAVLIEELTPDALRN